jgi:hypothetical protein
VHDLAVGGHQLEAGDVVAGQPQQPGQPTHPAAEGEAADAGVRDVARRGRQPERLGGPIEVAEPRAARAWAVTNSRPRSRGTAGRRPFGLPAWMMQTRDLDCGPEGHAWCVGAADGQQPTGVGIIMILEELWRIVGRPRR